MCWCEYGLEVPEEEGLLETWRKAACCAPVEGLLCSGWEEPWFPAQAAFEYLLWAERCSLLITKTTRGITFLKSTTWNWFQIRIKCMINDKLLRSCTKEWKDLIQRVLPVTQSLSSAGGGEWGGGCIIWVQRCGQRRWELDIGQVRKRTAIVVNCWFQRSGPLLVRCREQYASETGYGCNELSTVDDWHLSLLNHHF